MEKLINSVNNINSKHFVTYLDENDKPVNNITNKGLNIGEYAIVNRTGEYYGLTIEALSKCKSILTSYYISKAIKFIYNDKLNYAVAILDIIEEVEEYGYDVLFYTILLWFKKFKIINYDKTIFKFSTKKIKSDIKSIYNRIFTDTSTPINCKFIITDIGKGKKHPPIPESWIGKEFNNATEMHSEMDKLEWRIGCSPVTYCCTYSMIIVNKKSWFSLSKLKNNLDVDYIIYLYSNNKYTKRNICFINKNKINKWFSKLDNKIIENYMCLSINNFVIVCNYNSIFTKEINIENANKDIDNVGVLSSRLQKCIRRGPSCNKLIIETIDKLSIAKPYNLPDQQFIKVSPIRQLFWRLLISIIEDVRPYKADTNSEILTIEELAILSLITQNDPSLYILNHILNLVKNTCCTLLNNNSKKDCINYEKSNKSNNTKYLNKLLNFSIFKNNNIVSINNSDNNSLLCMVKIIYVNMPMMDNDRQMLLKLFNMTNKNIFVVSKIKLHKYEYIKNQKLDINCLRASYDMHCIPQMLILIQSTLSINQFGNYKLSDIANHIWNVYSCINIRKTNNIKDKDIILSKSILEVQKYINQEYKSLLDEKSNFYNKLLNEIKNKNTQIITKYNSNNITEYIKRLSFMIIFSKKFSVKYKNSLYDVIIAGDLNNPYKFKKISRTTSEYITNSELITELTNKAKEYLTKKNKVKVELKDPPSGFKWIFNEKYVNVYVKNNNFYANDIKVNMFNGENLLKENKKISIYKFNKYFKNLIKIMFYNYDKKKEYHDLYYLILCSIVSLSRFNNNDFKIYNWTKYINIEKIPMIIWKTILMKIYLGDLTCGPCNRSGEKTEKSINYYYEGIVYRFLLTLSAIYPNVIYGNKLYKHSHKYMLRINLNKNTNEYNHLLFSLKQILFSYHKINNNITTIKPTLKTNLWEHQQNTVTNVINGIKTGKSGYGDASSVGSGKTLTAIGCMISISKINNKKELGNGFLVLVPTETLYKTWINELEKHTTTFNIAKMVDKGKLQFLNKNNKSITCNTIVISTLGRMRDYPIDNIWSFICIDECISVQNKNALHTESAWAQSMCSAYGIILLSATFFKSRFDKLFYMLKMLNTGLPMEKNYLDTILSDSIICNINKSDKIWTSNVTKYALPAKISNEYYNIINTSKNKDNYEKLYNELNSFITKKYKAYKYMFNDAINKLEKTNKKCKILIFAKSSKEADDISNYNNNVSLYPDKSKIHVVVSYSKGTYGLNDLTDYNCIITRPDALDQIIQRKGRLDRPGNKNKNLHLEYILLKNTIEEALLLRLENASNFYKNYIMPLSEFYKLAIEKSVK